MPYSIAYSKKFEAVQEYMSDLENLDEGKTLAIEVSSPSEAEKLRWLFYDYLNLIGLRKIFFIQNHRSYLLIGRKMASPSSIVARSKKSFHAAYDEMFQKILRSEDPSKEFIKLLEEKEASFGTIAMLMAEYSRVMGL